MAVRAAELVVHVGADTKDAERGLSSVSQRIEGVAKGLAVGLAGAAVGAAGGLAVAVKAAAGFEKTMSGVKAVSGASADELAQLSGLALKLGKDTAFSASQAGQGLEELVKGGVSIADIMNGAASATLNLAAAGGVDLASAAEIASNALNTFALKGSDMAHVADLIAGAANASAIDVSDFRLSLAASGAVAATVGLSFDDLAVGIAAMGNAGIKGSDAGTSLKTMLLGLQPQTKEQTALFRELGLLTASGANAFFDASGKAKGLADIAQTLQTALAGMTQQQKLATLETIFGTDAIRAAAVFSNAGAEGFNTLAASMSKVTAETVGAERLNNLAGDMEQLKGSAETAAIALGTALLPSLRGGAQAATGFINAAIPWVEATGPRLVASVTELAGTVQGTGVRALTEGRLALDALAPTGERVGRAVDALKGLVDRLTPALQGTTDAAGAWTTAGVQSEGMLQTLIAAVNTASGAIESATTFVTGNSAALSALAGITASITTAWALMTAATVAQTIATGAQTVATGLLTTAQQALNFAMTANPIGAVIVLVAGLTAYIVTLYNTNEDARKIIDAAMAGIGSAIGGMVAGAQTVLGALQASINAVASAAQNLLGVLRSIPDHVTTTITEIRETVERTISGRASGGPVLAGTPYIVGEVGPELFVPNASGTIVPHGALGGGLSDGDMRRLAGYVAEAISQHPPIVRVADIRDGLQTYGRSNGTIFGGVSA